MKPETLAHYARRIDPVLRWSLLQLPQTAGLSVFDELELLGSKQCGLP
ncbi:hypothetical protein ACNKH9_19410 [Metapseudomonas otitidis]